MQWRKRVVMAGLSVAALVMSATPLAAAQQSSSAHYQVNEVYFGSGGDLNDCSAHYCSKQSAGELAVGNATSSHYQMNAGFNTSDVPVLEVAVNGGTFDLGVLSASSANTATTTFTIRNYLSSGYVVHLVGGSPTMVSGAASHTITAMSTAGASTVGTEQFGVNLRANTSPNVGADVQQQPDSTFGFGAPSTGYNTVNQFKFVNNDVVAASPKSSGTTLYTLSMIANISGQTPAGAYTGNLNVVVVPTF